ncbi:MAG: ferredoxin reductase [Mycobacterium sp.]
MVVSGALGRLRGVAAALTSPLHPDDYLKLINPLWSARELRGRIVAVRPETRDSATLVIKPGWGFGFDYQPGQYIGIGVLVDGRWRWRSYSLTSVPHTGKGRRPLDRTVTITVKAMPEGFLSSHLVAGVRPGTIVRLAAPQGNFVLPDPAPEAVLFLTAGSGITPVMSMLRTMARRNQIGGQERSDSGNRAGGQERSDSGNRAGGQERSDSGNRAGGQERSDSGIATSDVLHIHSVPSPEDLMFGDELAELSRTAPGYRLTVRATRADGRLDLNRLDEVVPDWRQRQTWVCGPENMLADAERNWTAEGLAGNLHLERFAAARAATPGEGGTVRFQRAGRSVAADAATTIMEAGEQAGVLMPFGCRMGICHTCVVSLLEGRVRDLRTGAEFEPGNRVQTCVCAPAGDCVVDI